MSSTVKLDTLVKSLVSDSPPCELRNVINDMSVILGDESKSTINYSAESFISSGFNVISPGYIVSPLNKLTESSKFIDFVGRQLFNIDIENSRAVDVEDYDPQVEYPSYYDGLIDGLNKYGEDHYQSEYAFTAIPFDGGLTIIVVGQRSNFSNYYTGQWKGQYTIESGKIEAKLEVDIHYFEEGNVRLQYKNSASSPLAQINESEILNYINSFEDSNTLSILKKFDELNQRSFKNLRRLLPVTRSKLNWGNAIGNYRLGSDVVNKS